MRRSDRVEKLCATKTLTQGQDVDPVRTILPAKDAGKTPKGRPGTVFKRIETGLPRSTIALAQFLGANLIRVGWKML